MNLAAAPEPIADVTLNIHSKPLCNLPVNRVMICIETHGVLEPPPQSYKDPKYTSRVASYSPELSNPNPHNLVPSLKTMTTAIVLPTLTQWVEGHITAINEATNDKDLTRALDDFLSKNATIVVNGIHISRAEFETQLQGEKFLETGATVSFLGAVQVPADKERPFEASSGNDVSLPKSTTKLSL
jgi:hypothetical protein